MSHVRCLVVSQAGTREEIDLDTPPSETDCDYEYFINICKHLVQQYGLSDMRFVISHDMGMAREVDPRTVVFVSGDEGCRLPTELSEARLILKCYGEKPRYPDRWRASPGGVVEVVRHVAEAVRYHWAARRLDPHKRQRLFAKVQPLPMGYCRQLPVPFMAFDQRPYLASFSGSIDNQKHRPLSRQAIIDRPKRESRLRMMKALRQAEAELPPGTVHIHLTESFAASLGAAGQDYAQMLIRTKISICPRGTRLETFRIHEAMRFGCVVIAEKLPDVAYLREAPYISIWDWRKLPDLLRDLEADETRLLELHHRSLEWWANVTSPPAMAAKIARLLSDEGGMEARPARAQCGEDPVDTGHSRAKAAPQASS